MTHLEMHRRIDEVLGAVPFGSTEAVRVAVEGLADVQEAATASSDFEVLAAIELMRASAHGDCLDRIEGLCGAMMFACLAGDVDTCAVAWRQILDLCVKVSLRRGAEGSCPRRPGQYARASNVGNIMERALELATAIAQEKEQSVPCWRARPGRD